MLAIHIRNLRNIRINSLLGPFWLWRPRFRWSWSHRAGAWGEENCSTGKCCWKVPLKVYCINISLLRASTTLVQRDLHSYCGSPSTLQRQCTLRSPLAHKKSLPNFHTRYPRFKYTGDEMQCANASLPLLPHSFSTRRLEQEWAMEDLSQFWKSR